MYKWKVCLKKQGEQEKEVQIKYLQGIGHFINVVQEFCKKLQHYKGLGSYQKDELKERYWGNESLMRQSMLKELLSARVVACLVLKRQSLSQSLSLLIEPVSERMTIKLTRLSSLR